MLLNLDRVILIGIGFFLLFVAYGTSRLLSTKIMADESYNNLGFYALAIMYITFGSCSFFAGIWVLKLGDKLSMFLGAICQAIYISSFILPLERIQHPDGALYSNTWVCYVVVLFGAAISGLGESILWVSGLSYISRCAGE